MIKWVVRIALLLLISLLPGVVGSAQVPPAESTDWWTLGKTDLRQNASSELFGPVTASLNWSLDLGPSGSQPLFVQGRVFHLTARGLWEITPAGEGQLLVDEWINYVGPSPTSNEPIFRPPTSSLTYARIQGQEVLYFGTGSNQVCAFALSTAQLTCYPVSRPEDEPITAVPLVLKGTTGEPLDVVIVGTKAGSGRGGRLWVIPGLASASDPQGISPDYLQVSDTAWVTGSATPVAPLEFLWTADGVDDNDEGRRYNGWLALSRVVPSPSGLRLQIGVKSRLHAGVAASFVHGGDQQAYVLDNAANLLRVVTELARDDEGPKVRTIQMDPIAASTWLPSTGLDPDGLAFANAEAGVDKQTVYFSIREVGTRKADLTHPGALVAVDRASWTIKWHRQLPHPANTNPLVWSAQSLVLVGDTHGNLYGFHTETGEPAAFALAPARPKAETAAGGDVCLPVSERSFLQGDEEPYRARHAFQQLNGSGTNPMLASGGTGRGLLLVGVNAQVKGSDETRGRLVAYAAGETYNMYWTEAPPAITKVLPAGTETVRGEVAAVGKVPTDRPVAVGWFFEQPGGAVRRLGSTMLSMTDVASLAEGQSIPVEMAYRHQPGDDGGRITGVLNESAVLLSPLPEGKRLRHLLREALRGQSSSEEQRLLDRLQSGDLKALDGEGEGLAALYDRLGLPGNCQVGGTAAEWVEAGPHLALRDNLIETQVEKLLNDPLISHLGHPQGEAVQPFLVRVEMGYRTGGKSPADVGVTLTTTDSKGKVRRFSVSSISLPANGYAWHDFSVDGHQPGRVDLTAELILPPGFEDTNPVNNSAQGSLQLVKPAAGSGSGKPGGGPSGLGSKLTD